MISTQMSFFSLDLSILLIIYPGFILQHIILIMLFICRQYSKASQTRRIKGVDGRVVF